MLKKYEEQYRSQLEILLKDYNMCWGKDASETLVVLEQSEVIGVGSLSKNNIHPYREYVKVFVRQDMRNKGMGRTIYEALLNFAKLKKLQVSVSSQDVTAVSFIRKCGFQVVRKCYEIELGQEKNVSASLPNRAYTSFEELSPEQKTQVVQLQMKNYRQFHHAINPLNEQITLKKWEEIVLNGLDASSSFVWQEGETVEAYIFCYEGEESKSIEIGYVGGNNVNQLQEYQVFYRDIIAILHSEFITVSIEADNVDPYASAVLSDYDYEKTDSWDTYIQDMEPFQV